MTSRANDALKADRDALLEIAAGLSDSQWKADSGCPGWSVQDVVAHMGALFWMVVDPSTLPATGDLPTEQAQEVYVDARRTWGTSQVVDDYRSVSQSALEQLGVLEAQDFEVPLGDLGTYPASLLPNAFAFDHYTHIRADLFAPRGPLTGIPPGADGSHLAPVIDWVAAALPQQNPTVLGALDESGAVEIRLVGESARVIEIGTGPAVATLTSSAPALIRWVTQRGSWEELGVEADGDARALAAVRRAHVF
jgi:uncharacterized protein (TIGR03083 family)